MKYLSILVLVALSTSCGIYTRSNTKDKNNKKPVDGELQFDSYEDASNDYSFFNISTPFLVFSPQSTKSNFYVPLGPEISYSNSKIGDIETHAYFLAQMGNYATVGGEAFDDPPKQFNWGKLPLEFRGIYAYPVWRTNEWINKYQMNIGSAEGVSYYGIFPTQVEIAIAIRGGYDHVFNTFLSDELTSHLSESYPTLEDVRTVDYLYLPPGDLRYNQSSGALKFGISFQRKVATRFTTTIKGNSFSPSHYETQGFYADIAVLTVSDKSQTELVVDYTSGSGQSIEYLSDNVTLGVSDLFKRRFLGAAIGYKFCKQGREFGLPFRIRFEVGVQPGYFPKAIDGLYARAGVGLGFGTR